MIRALRRHYLKVCLLFVGVMLAIAGAIADAGVVFALGCLLAAFAWAQLVTYAILGFDPEGAI